jgi:LysR family transcriptional regulator, low CO2-responsive transcriptional regulator
MNIDQLIAFERVVREGSFSKAAWSLGLAQPTISARIQGLEQSVGGKLFQRGRKVTLTEKGISFLPYARRAIATLQEGVEAIRLAHRGERGKLSVGVLRSLTGKFLSPALAKFQKHYPEVECYVREGEHWQLVELLADGVIELAIICYPVIDPALTDITPIVQFREEVVLAASQHHPIAKKRSVTKAEILEHAKPFMLLRWWQATPTPITALASQANSVADLPTDTGKFLLREGRGLGFFTKMIILPELESGLAAELKVTDMPTIYRDSALVHLTRTQLSPASNNFVTFIKAEATKQKMLLEPNA